jgi:predicted NAD-dependent protein-ADP-ribosyltransferase YbiA (DUF1768 family)
MSKKRRSEGKQESKRKKQRTSPAMYHGRPVFTFHSRAVETDSSSAKLSNFFGAPFSTEDESWCSVEHFYQGQKFVQPYRARFTAEGVYSSTTSKESKKLFSRGIKGWSKMDEKKREEEMTKKLGRCGLHSSASTKVRAKNPIGILAKMANTELRNEQKQKKNSDRKIASEFATSLPSVGGLGFVDAQRVMMPALWAKFTQNPELGSLLRSTGDAYLLEQAGRKTNVWNGRLVADEDGTLQLDGENYMGRLLMGLRQELSQTH